MKTYIRKMALALALGGLFLPATPIFSQEAAVTPGLIRGGPPLSFGLGKSGKPRRFIYGNFSETRRQKAARTFRLSMAGAPGEVASILTFPFKNPKTTAKYLLGAAALIAVDRKTTAFWQDKVEPAFDGFSPPPLFGQSSIISIESQYVIAAVGLTYAGGLAFNDERAQTAALLSTKAIAYSYLTSQVILKPLFGRVRPVTNLSTFTGAPGDYTTNPWVFGQSTGIPFTGGTLGTSMPSFHFTQYFAIARVYSGMYDNNFLPYVAAGVMSASNIRGHHHWVSDMVAGAVIGTAIGSLILNSYEDRKYNESNLMVMPIISRDNVGFTVSMSF